MSGGELIFRAACVLFFAVFLPQAWRLGGIRRYGEVGSGFWPLVILSLATLLSLLFFLQGLWNTIRDSQLGGKRPLLSADTGRCLLAITIVLGYLLLIPWTGFVAATPFFILLFMLGLGERRVGPLLVAPVLITIGLFLFFVEFIQIPLPRGSGIFLTFSRILY